MYLLIETYYEQKGLELFREPYEKERIINPALKRTIDKKLEDALNTSAAFIPASKNGKAINVRVAVNRYSIEVRQHKVRLMKNAGC